MHVGTLSVNQPLPWSPPSTLELQWLLGVWMGRVKMLSIASNQSGPGDDLG
jgi:hypothetical protein